MIIYKQRYKAMNLKNTKILNQKHLHYFATRRGTIYNEGASFGLFGKLQYMDKQADINSLEFAEKLVGEVSGRRTIYRGVLSLRGEDAIEKGFYDRENWETLLQQKINIIAKEMDIDNKDFNYLASFHMKKNQPHVHLMFWDNSTKIRQEFMAPKAFEIASEHIRCEFAKGIFREEILENLNIGKNVLKEARVELLANMLELNTKEIFDIEKLSISEQENLTGEFLKLVDILREDKNRRYKYLNPKSKNAIDNFVDILMENGQFKTLMNTYERSADNVSKLYGNGPEKGKYERESAIDKLKNGLGNEILKFVKEHNLANHSMSYEKSKEELINIAKNICLDNIKTSDIYKDTLAFYPKNRTPISGIIGDEFNENIHKLTLNLLKDNEFIGKYNIHLENTILEKVKTNNWEGTNEQFKEHSKEQYSDIYKEIRKIVLESLYKDAGYKIQFISDKLLDMTVDLFGLFGQNKNQMQNKEIHNMNNKNLSKAQKKDLKFKLKDMGMER